MDLSRLIIYVRSDNNNDNIDGLYENAKDHDCSLHGRVLDLYERVYPSTSRNCENVSRDI